MARDVAIRMLFIGLCALSSPGFLYAQNSSGEPNQAIASSQQAVRYRDTRQPITPRDGSAESEQSESGRAAQSTSLIETLGALLIVIVLFLGAAALWRKHAPAGSRNLPAQVMQVLGRRSIDQRNTMYLVRLGSRILVLGSSAQGLQTLAEVTDPVEVDFLAGQCASTARDGAGMPPFGALFERKANSANADSRRQTRTTPATLNWNSAAHRPEDSHV